MIGTTTYDAISGGIDAIVWIAANGFLALLIWVIFRTLKSTRPSRDNRASTGRSTPKPIFIGSPNYRFKFSEETQNLLDSFEQFPERVDGWYKDPSGTAKLRYHHEGRWTPATVQSDSAEEKTSALRELFNHQTDSVEGSRSIEEFLRDIPAPQIRFVEEVAGSWQADPIGRWNRRFHQGTFGRVGWTNRVMDTQGVESIDFLTFDELVSLDNDYPVEAKPQQVGQNDANAGWYPDPTGFFSERFWSGRSWTIEVRDERGSQLTWRHTTPPIRPPVEVEPASLPQLSDSDPVAPPPITHNREDRILAIARLLDEGLISKSEFLKLKSEIFGQNLE
jgi:hypothetical protein